jgi:hypothetical protein
MIDVIAGLLVSFLTLSADEIRIKAQGLPFAVVGAGQYQRWSADSWPGIGFMVAEILLSMGGRRAYCSRNRLSR